ncbi:MAG TPA: L,D-transpeptidase [Pyrinomonadaceae bacterium]|nr:L,D-transpeptidase [Pyrinomonadaceae bacterium]
MNFSGKHFIVAALLAVLSGAVSAASAQKLASPYRSNESVRSDKFTGGRVERAELIAGERDIEITVDVPAFRLTLWQNGKEIKTYAVGVGKKDFPISIGEKQASEIIWNPDWIPPNSEWVVGRKGIKAGEVIRASDPRNPLGKLKIPLGYGYLIHQAAAPTDLGNLVSHGCIRMLRADLYDLAEKIVAARSLDVSPKKIANAKVTKNTVVAKLEEPLIVDINYDTQVVEGGQLHLYPDVYERGTNTVAALRAELESSGVDASAIDDATFKRMLARVNAKQKYVVSVESIAAGRALADGRVLPIVGQPAATKKKVAVKRRAA